jgi:transcriptional regulator with XRE-family HTH domain
MGYTQEDLAARTGFHRTYIGDVERGLKNITVNNCSIIATALCITLSDLMHKAEACLSYYPDSDDL